MSMGLRRHVLEIHCRHLGVLATVNGFVVADGWDERARVSVSALAPFLDADNRLELWLRPLAVPPSKPEPSCEVRLGAPAGGAALSAVSLRLGWTWSERECRLEPAASSKVLEHRFRVAEPRRWGWHGARPYRDEDRRRIEAAVLLAHAAVGDKDTSSLELLLTRKITELAIGYEMQRAQLLDQMVAEWADVMSASDYQVMPLRGRDLVLEPALGGRVVHVRGADGRPAIVATGGGLVQTLPLSLSCLEEEWVTVR